MPKLVRLYITSVATGFGLSVVFVMALLAMDVAGLRHLVLDTDKGWLAALMLVIFNGIVFAGVQFGIRVMGMADAGDPPKRGRPAPAASAEPVLVKAPAVRG